MREEPTPTTTTPPTTEAPPAEPEPRIGGELDTEELAATQNGSDFDLNGRLTLADGREASVAGRLYVQDGQVKVDLLRIQVGGVEYVLKFRGRISASEVNDDGSTTYLFGGRFSLPNGRDLGLPEDGDLLSGSFRNGAAASLHLELEGPAPKGS